MKIITIVGARPQFIKAAAVSREIAKRKNVEEIILHTGQHFDENMSGIFFRELRASKPTFNLNIHGGSHGEMTGRMLQSIEECFLRERPDYVLLYGDTNSTLAGALAAAKLGIPVGHVESGVRSFDLTIPEEANRVVADVLSKDKFCPSQTAVGNLRKEGITKGVVNVGDVMYDLTLHFCKRNSSRILQQLALEPQKFVLATCHRANNTDDASRLREILSGLRLLAKDKTVVLPLHPRTRMNVERFGLSEILKPLRVIDPVGYLDMIKLEESAELVITDSGGVQKEAYFFRVPCLSIMNETPWVETVASGWNRLVDANSREIERVGRTTKPGKRASFFYGDGNAATKIVELIASPNG